MVVRALLRCLGVAFEDSEIVAGGEEPVDVEFRAACAPATCCKKPPDVLTPLERRTGSKGQLPAPTLAEPTRKPAA
jgi:hypothetical protein